MSVLKAAHASGSPATAPALDKSVWRDWVATGRARERRNDATRWNALNWLAIAGLAMLALLYKPIVTLTAFLTLAVISTAAADLSTYRNVQLGTELTTVSKQLSMDPSDAKVIHRRPALIQELEWRPQQLRPTSETESVSTVSFRFYERELFQIVIAYDAAATEGLTVDDLVQAVSASYGAPASVPRDNPGYYDGQEEVLATWEDERHRFDLLRSAHGPGLSLVGTLKRLDAPSRTAVIEAERLDYNEAPQREAARRANDEKAAKSRRDEARSENKPSFRP